MILAMDCATATGWCAGDGSTPPILGNVKMPSGADVDLGPFLTFWRKWLLQLFADIKPTVVVYESPFVHSNMNGNTMLKLMGMCAVLEQVCDESKVMVEKTTPSHVKKVLTGSGKSEKPDMMRVARKCGVAPKTFDEADAFGVWLAAVQYHAKAHQPHWDKKLYQAGGALM